MMAWGSLMLNNHITYKMQKENKPMKIEVLGTGCKKCNKLYDEVQKAITQARVSAELSKVEKIEEIVKYGVAFTPALVIDGKVKAAGIVPKAAQIEAWLKESD